MTMNVVRDRGRLLFFDFGPKFWETTRTCHIEPGKFVYLSLSGLTFSHAKKRPGYPANVDHFFDTFKHSSATFFKKLIHP